MSLRDFLARSRWGTQWGVVDAQHPTGHRGHDIVMAAHEDELTVRAGRVVTLGLSSALGYYTVLKVDGAWDYYCHQLQSSRHSVGTVLAAGDVIGQAAGPNDVHGTAWTGPHLHYGSGPSYQSVTSGATFDATEIVAGVLASLAGTGGTTPIVDPPAPPPLPKKGSGMKTIVMRSIKSSFNFMDDGRIVYQYVDPNGRARAISAAQSFEPGNGGDPDYQGAWSYTDDEFAWQLWDLGRIDISVAQIKSDIASGKVVPGGQWMPPWLTGKAPTPVDISGLSATLAKAVTDAIAAAPVPTAETVAAAVEAALHDNFAALPSADQIAAATVKAEGSALSNG